MTSYTAQNANQTKSSTSQMKRQYAWNAKPYFQLLKKQDEILLELKKHTALLKQLLHQRKGVSNEERERLLTLLERRKYLTTSEVMVLLQVSRDTALKIMRSLALNPGIKYFHGEGNKPSRIVKMKDKVEQNA